MVVSQRRLHYRTVSWMKGQLGQAMPEKTNLCRYFWSVVISITLFPILWVIWGIIKWPIFLLLLPFRMVWFFGRRMRGREALRRKPVLRPVVVKPKRIKAGLIRLLPTLAYLPKMLWGLLRRISLGRPAPQPLPIEEAEEICYLQRDFVQRLLGVFILIVIGDILFLLVPAVFVSHLGYKVLGDILGFTFLFFYIFTFLAATMVECILRPKASHPERVTSRWFVYRHRKGVEQFNNFVHNLSDFGRLVWEYLMAKKEKICPIIVFVD